jgi:hypothetical protein
MVLLNDLKAEWWVIRHKYGFPLIQFTFLFSVFCKCDLGGFLSTVSEL